jgi:hypothetical protein
MKVYKKGKCVQNAKAESDDSPSSEKDAAASEKLLLTLIKKHKKRWMCSMLVK